MITSSGSVVKFTDGTYGICDRLLAGYIPINESQFKRTTMPYLLRYPEGKRDKSYTIKKRAWIYKFDENGNGQSVDGFVDLSNPITSFSTAFNNAQFLKELKVEDGITSVYGVIRTYGSTDIPIGIEKITIPASLVFMGRNDSETDGYWGMFSYLENLKEYNVDKKNPVFKSVNGVLLSKDGKILYSMPCKIGKKYTIPDGVELIASSAFANTHNMTIMIPASVKYLGFNSLEDSEIENHPQSRFSYTVFNNSSDITLNVSSNTTLRDIFESLPERCGVHASCCSNLTVNFAG